MRHKFLGIGEPGYHPVAKLRTVASGLRYAFVYDLSVAYKLGLSVPVIVAAFFLRERVDFLLIFAATAFVLVAEIFNSAIEALCDIVQSRRDERIKVVKDIAAAGAGLAILTWMVVLAVEIGEMLAA